jgi:hypothetical protein
MKIRHLVNKHYILYFEIDDGRFAIGVDEELFNRHKVKVLHKEGPNYFVAKEYVTYDDNILMDFILDLLNIIRGVDSTKVDGWKTLLKYLPKTDKKYLEDDQQFKRKTLKERTQDIAKV